MPGLDLTPLSSTQPVDLDNAGNGAALFRALYAKLQAQLAPMLAPGPFADRPAPGVVGRRYPATDVEIMFLDLGTAWVRDTVGSTGVTASDISSALKPSGTAAPGTEALRALGTTADTAAAGNDARLNLLYSPAEGVVKTDGKLVTGDIATGRIDAGDGTAQLTRMGAVGPGGQSGLVFGNSLDTNLYRFAVNTLRTSGALVVGGNIPNSAAVLSAIAPAGIEFGHSNAGGYRGMLGALPGSGANYLALHAEGGTTGDTWRTRGVVGHIIKTNLSNALQFGVAANANADNQGFTLNATLEGGTLTAEANLMSRADTYAQVGSAYQTRIGNTSGMASIVFGPASDTYIVRAAANRLQASGEFFSGGRLIAAVNTSTHVNIGQICGFKFGPTEDTNLYRLSPGALKTDSILVGANDIYLRHGGAQQVRVGMLANGGANGLSGIAFGLSEDVSIYRAGAGILQTDGQLTVGGALRAPYMFVGSGARLRPGATDGDLEVVTQSDDNWGSVAALGFRLMGGGIRDGAGASRMDLFVNGSGGYANQGGINFYGGMYVHTLDPAAWAPVHAGTFIYYNSAPAAASDRRFKENVTALDGALEKVLALRPVVFDWKADAPRSGEGEVGFIAQDVQAVIPNAIMEMEAAPEADDEDPYLALAPTEIIPFLVGAVKELSDTLDTLKAKIT